MIKASESVFTFSDELGWLKENVFYNRSVEFDFIYSKVFRGLHSENMRAFLTNIIVTMSTIQLKNSKCYGLLSSSSDVENRDNATSKFTNFCKTHKVLVAVVGPHASLLEQCYMKNDNQNLLSMVALYEKYSPRINFYQSHIQTLEQISGYSFNIIWPAELNNEASIDSFIKKCKIN